MPKLHEYISGRGFYIKAAFGGSIVTYQLSSTGNQYLRSRGYRDGSNISPRKLQDLIQRGYAYTGGAGPGDIEGDEEYSDLYPRYLTKKAPRPRGPSKISSDRQTATGNNLSTGGSIAAGLIFLCLCLFGFSVLNNSSSETHNTGEQATNVISQKLKVTIQQTTVVEQKPTATTQATDTSPEAVPIPTSTVHPIMVPSKNPPGEVSFYYEISNEESVIPDMSYAITNTGSVPLANPRIRIVNQFVENNDVHWDIVWRDLPLVLQPGESIRGEESIHWLAFNEDSFLGFGLKEIRESLVEVVWDKYTDRPGVHLYHWQEEEFYNDLIFVIVNNQDKSLVGVELIVDQFEKKGFVFSTKINGIEVGKGKSYRGVAKLSKEWTENMRYTVEIVLPQED